MNAYITETYHRLIEELELKNHRYLYQAFALRDRLTGLIGPRGVGKTTLLLQYIKEHLYSEGKAFYFSADMVYFDSLSERQKEGVLHCGVHPRRLCHASRCPHAVHGGDPPGAFVRRGDPLFAF